MAESSMVYQFSTFSYAELLLAAVTLFFAGVACSRARERNGAPLLGLLLAMTLFAVTSTFRLASLLPRAALLWTQIGYLSQVVMSATIVLYATGCCVVDVRRKPALAALLATVSLIVLLVQEVAALRYPSAVISDTAAGIAEGLSPGPFNPAALLSDIYLVAGLAAALAVSFIQLFRQSSALTDLAADRSRRAAVTLAMSVGLAGYVAGRAGYATGSSLTASASAFWITVVLSLVVMTLAVVFLSTSPGGKSVVLRSAQAVLFQTMSDGSVILDATGRIMGFNTESVFAFPSLSESSIGKPFVDVVAAETELARLVASPEGGQTDLAVEDGERPRFFEIVVSSVVGETSRVVGHLVTARNVTRHYELLDEVKALMIRDPLTGVYTRRHFEELAAHEIARARRTDRSVTLLRIDVDHFRHINEIAGRTEGDTILRKMAHACQRAIRSGDILCRSGADGFLAFLSETDIPGAESVASRLLTAAAALTVELPAGTASQDSSAAGPIRVTVSIGVSGGSKGAAHTVGELVRDADLALVEAKESGRNRYRVNPAE
ncbi:MAG TPA: diguanylate cyclase [Spirochaetia bacterium]|nr:diguanylate cyclase [Spirochaetia bacterium]